MLPSVQVLRCETGWQRDGNMEEERRDVLEFLVRHLPEDLFVELSPAIRSSPPAYARPHRRVRVARGVLRGAVAVDNI